MARSGEEDRAAYVSPEDVRRLCEFLYRRTGMLFAEDKRYYIDRRLHERIAATGAQSFQAYFALLRSGLDSEVEHLVNAFTINETYFFREDHQLRCMTSDLLGAVIRTKRPGDPIRIWSVPCSTGEEPYSIAIWLMENFPGVDNYQIEIVGSDIDTRALAAAADGVYGARALMKLSPALIARYFENVSADAHRIDAGLRASIQFTEVNLIDARATARHGRFDIIFCRNVLIYFERETQRKVIEQLCSHLRPGGYLLVGHSESMIHSAVPGLKQVQPTIFKV